MMVAAKHRVVTLPCCTHTLGGWLTIGCTERLAHTTQSERRASSLVAHWKPRMPILIAIETDNVIIDSIDNLQLRSLIIIVRRMLILWH